VSPIKIGAQQGVDGSDRPSPLGQPHNEKNLLAGSKEKLQMATDNKKRSLPVIPSDREDDLHNLEFVDSADLVLFVAGNQFMVMRELLQAFQETCPDVKRIFYETLPPGLELKQILAGGALFRDRIIDVFPDVYASVTEKAMERLEEGGFISRGDYFLYLHNRIVLMVPEGNPAMITSVSDLGREEVRISQPNPEYEDIAHYIIEMYRQAGGQILVDSIMEQKRAEGTTILTIVHHRETPLRITKSTVDVGPVWATEIIHAQQTGLGVEMVEPGQDLDQRDKINYYMCCLQNATNRENAERFLAFIKSNRAQSIYEAYGFVPHFVGADS
jgi:ABC-type molybdate transport system substrate-binding protein